MSALASHPRLLAYHDWANRESLGAVLRETTPTPDAVRLLAHVVACDDLWIGRVRLDPTPVIVRPTWSTERLSAEIDRMPSV